MKNVEFFFDIFSPYAYLAFHRLTDIAKSTGTSIIYHPINLVKMKKAAGNTGPPNRAIPPKIKYLNTDLQRWATIYGLPLGNIKGTESARINKGTFCAMQHGCEHAYLEQAWELVWGVGGDPDSDDLLIELASYMNWDASQFLSFVSSDEADALYESNNEKAVARGVFGVPLMIVEEHMWWGNDRLDFVEEYLRGNP